MARLFKVCKGLSFQKKRNFAAALICLVVSVVLLLVLNIAGVADDGTCAKTMAAAGLSIPGGNEADAGC